MTIKAVCVHSVQCVQCGFARQGDDRESSQSGE